MLRTISVLLELELFGATDMVFSMTPALGSGLVSESLSFTSGNSEHVAREIVDVHGTRLHLFSASAGRMTVAYEASAGDGASPEPTDERELITYLRPSRYCQSDSLTPLARSEFSGLSGHNLLRAVTQWVSSHLSYVGGSSLPTDGATRTLLSRRGVCRDFAHVTIALLRAMEIPARMVAVYAPGLWPMDFHAVVEAWVDGAWWVVDTTGLAPRQALVRISTGRDAADTAWLTSMKTDLSVVSMSLTVTADNLPHDDGSALVQLA
jgi:transglutaminase-like putative cysteine protease